MMKLTHVEEGKKIKKYSWNWGEPFFFFVEGLDFQWMNPLGVSNYVYLKRKKKNFKKGSHPLFEKVWCMQIK